MGDMYGRHVMKIVTLKLEESLYAKVLALAKRRKTTQSAVIRDAITACFRKEKVSHMGSALDLSKDLAGCVTGPADLSTKKIHLSGFGR
jgi:predicted transcriptional regulator